MSKSYKRTDWLGNEYWEHEDGSRSYEREDWLGNKYLEHSDGSRSYEREDWLGNKYKEHSDGSRSYEREDWLGNKYEEHDDKGSGGCFVTTACVEYAGLPDDCWELTMLRRLRDDYLKGLPWGKVFLSEYYATAPAIVAAIRSQPDQGKVFDALLHRARAVARLIEDGQVAEAAAHCRDQFAKLKRRYLGSDHASQRPSGPEAV
ncbi:hypothetical protein HRbin33_01092 [bacterium HR33]|nr:hypothetical protein HRbin33_01092 [bacterium HR33]